MKYMIRNCVYLVAIMGMLSYECFGMYESSVQPYSQPGDYGSSDIARYPAGSFGASSVDYKRQPVSSEPPQQQRSFPVVHSNEMPDNLGGNSPKNLTSQEEEFLYWNQQQQLQQQQTT